MFTIEAIDSMLLCYVEKETSLVKESEQFL